jgi:Na+/melibiose symporter-like transporter
MTNPPPLADPEAEEGASASEQARAGIRVRLGTLFGRGDPILGVLVISTFVMTVGRGVFLALTVLYLAIVAGLSAGEIALASTISAVAGIAASYVGGWLADRLSARRLLFVLEALAALALASYVFVDDLVLAIVIGCLTFGFGSAAHSANAAVIARGFVGPARITARAVLRTVTNIGIAIGSGVAALALLIDTPEAYRILLASAGAVYLVATFPLLRLPARVDPGRGGSAEAAAAEALTTEAGPTASQRGRSPWRDRRYLLFVALASIFGIQFSVFEYGIPLWIEHWTDAPRVMVSVLLILNTAIVTAFTVVLSRGTEDPRRAGRVFGLAGVLMAFACVAYALAAGAPVWVAIVALLIGGVGHAFAEVLSQGAGWGLAFELADPRSAGAYQGLVGMGYGVLSAVGPPLLAVTALQLGLLGWILLAAMFLASAFGILVLGRHASITSLRSNHAA